MESVTSLQASVRLEQAQSPEVHTESEHGFLGEVPSPQGHPPAWPREARGLPPRLHLTTHPTQTCRLHPHVSHPPPKEEETRL